MSSNITNSPDSGGDRSDAPQAPGSGHMNIVSIIAVAAYLVLITGFVLYGLIKLWPYPTPSGERPDETHVAGSQTTANGQGNGSTPGNSQTAAGNNATSSTPDQSGSGQTQTPTGQTQTQNRNGASGSGANQKPARALPDPEPISFFGGRFNANVYLETRLLLLVMLAGALGSSMHSLRSLYWYTGNRMMVWSWVAFYLLLPLTGAMLATIFYFVVRGGFFSSQASFDTTSPFGFAALSALVGLFSPQATLKLKEVAETIFSKPEAGSDNRPQQSSPQAPVAPSPKPAPTITSVTPNSGAANDTVVIAGTNFSDGVDVKFGGISATVSTASSTSVTVVVPANPAASGPVDVQVTNSDGQVVTLAQGFTYVAGGGADTAAVDELEGDDHIKSNTTDEELPITEGGVE